ncbi:MAG: hypothetical protein AB1473_11190 [Thermodesulfobacteriota bacterium]
MSEPLRNNCVIVLGMHRAGTSALTRVINLLGVDLGHDFLEPTADNPAGYWEHRVIYHIHERMLNALGRTWHTLFPFPQNWWKDETIDPYRKQIVRALQQDFSGSALWGIKDPRMCRLMPLWIDVLQELESDPYFIIMFRHPEEVAKSLAERDGFSQDKCLLLWLIHFIESERETRGYPRVFVSFDSLMEDSRTETVRISETLGLEWPISIEDASDSISAHLQPALRHHRTASSAMAAESQYGEAAAELFEAMNAASSSEGGALSEVLTHIEGRLGEAPLASNRQLLIEDFKALQSRLAETDSWVKSREEDLAQCQHDLHRYRSQVEDIAARLECVLNSRSWKMTAPLRHLHDLFSRPAK